MAAPTLPAPKRLWPQPWPSFTPSLRSSRRGTASFPIPGRASNSARMPITGLPLPKVATKAVGIPATPRCTAKPSFSRMPARRAAERSSLSAVSECCQSSAAMRPISGASASASASTAAFAFGSGALPGAAEAQTAASSRQAASRMIDLQGSAKPSRGAERGQALLRLATDRTRAGPPSRTG